MYNLAVRAISWRKLQKECQMNPGILVFGMLLAGFAGAQTIIIGTANSGNAIPFGGGNDYTLYGGAPGGPAPISNYQQVYSDTAFASPVTIDALSFYCNPPYCPYANPALSSGSYELLLSTTSAAANGLSTNQYANIGTGEALVYAGNVPSETAGTLGGTFTFNLSSNYFYNPRAGNLLLTVAVQNQGAETIGLESDGSGVLTSRALMTYSGNVQTDSTGLVTGFGVVTAPEVDPRGWPSGLMLLIGSLAVLRGGRLTRIAPPGFAVVY